MTPDFDALRAHVPGILTCRGALRSAVLVPLIRHENGYDVLFEVRAGSIADQPGDICFPGGRMEAGETPRDTALRETCEELLIDPAQVHLLGQLDIHATTSLVIYPFVGEVTGYTDTYSTDEVARIIRVPLETVLGSEPEVYRITWRSERPENFPYDRVVGGRNYRWRQTYDDQYFYDFGGETVWGLTAKILRAFTGTAGKP